MSEFHKEINSGEEFKDDSYMSSIDKKIILLAGQNNIAQIKKIFAEEKEIVNVFAAKDSKDYSSNFYKY